MPKTLLLADDSVTIQKVVGISFANEDVVLLTVDNGTDAIARAAEARPDIVLADAVMPGKTGYEVCEAIKSNPALRHIPVLLLTGTFEAFDEERARRVGADGHITKPFEAQALVDEVSRLLARAQQPAPTQAPEPAAAPAAPQTASEPPARPAQAPTPPAAAPAPRPSDEAYDFFDDDLDRAAATDDAPMPRSAQTETVVLSESGSTPADGGARALPDASGRDAFAREEHETTLPRSAKAPEQPAPPTEDAWAASDDLGSALADDDVPSLEVDDFDAGSEADAPDLLAGEDDDAPAFALDDDHGASRGDGSPAPPAAAPKAESFDFEFSETPPQEPQAHDDDPLRGVQPELARETVLDPESARDYDVSSSDLGDSYRRAAGGAPEGQPALARSAPAAPSAPDITPATASSDDFPPVELEPPDLAPGDFEMPRAEEPAPRPAPVAAPAASPASPAPAQHGGDEAGATWGDAEPSAPARPPETMSDDTVMELGSEAEIEPVMDLDANARIQPEPGAAALPPAAFEPQPARGEARPAPAPDLSPVMRERIHDALEKIAWESFGDLSDTITRQVVQRVEAIAWEVIPQMAEALIREEIRRLKGEGESDS